MADEVRSIAVVQNRWIKLACAFPVSPTYDNARGINKTDWIEIDRALTTPASIQTITGRRESHDRAQVQVASSFTCDDLMLQGEVRKKKRQRRRNHPKVAPGRLSLQVKYRRGIRQSQGFPVRRRRGLF